MPWLLRSRCAWALFALLSIGSIATSAPAPLGAIVHPGGVTFRVWVPYADSVAVRINEGNAVAMAREPGHSDPADAVWSAEVPGAKAGDRYKYVIRCKGNEGEFIDPRGLQLSDYTPNASSVIVDMGARKPAPFTTPSLQSLVIYEMHIGSYNPDPAEPTRYDFAGAAQKLDYLQKLGINAIQLLPINENAVGGGGRRGRGGPATRSSGTAPGAQVNRQGPARRANDYDWGYDPSSYFAIKRSYGTPDEFLDLVNAAHAHGIAVIIDVVYNHMSGRNLLRNFGGYSTPEFPNGLYFNDAAHGSSPWGPRPDFSRSQVASFIEDNALMYLFQFGCDGERWDSVANLRAFSSRGNDTPNPNGIQLMRKAIDDALAAHPDKIFIAEDLRNESSVTKHTTEGGLGFDTQWDNFTCGAIRRAVTGDDASRDLSALAKVIDRTIGSAAFSRVIYSEDHDQVGHPPREIRMPALIDPKDPRSLKAKRLSDLAAAIVLTSPGVPMLFQGQEMLDPRTFTFGVNIPMDWSRVQTQAGTIAFYRDLISLRRNLDGHSAGLMGAHTQVYHVDDATHTLAYRRWDKRGDDVIVAINLSSSSVKATIGFPRPGRWTTRFGSNSTIYDSRFSDANGGEIVATAAPSEGLAASADVNISPYSVMIFSQQ
ncbi:MAG TPA: alpha-amylase family glycosyl hydrolase [Tepidisphaeraceae bacterium]|nr:alpha-amylase family glycosyl hydrolase [Tepidisphaeraceae bacterium]